MVDAVTAAVGPAGLVRGVVAMPYETALTPKGFTAPTELADYCCQLQNAHCWVMMNSSMRLTPIGSNDEQLKIRPALDGMTTLSGGVHPACCGAVERI
jgi:hypothetical protein